MDLENEQKNMIYYNQILRADNKKRHLKEKKTTSFAKKEVNLKDYIYVPDGFELIVYIAYFILIPYIVGAIFLFFTIAGADFSNFKLLDMSAFFIVWAIGYEIVAILFIIRIVVMFLKHNSDSD